MNELTRASRVGWSSARTGWSEEPGHGLPPQGQVNAADGETTRPVMITAASVASEHLTSEATVVRPRAERIKHSSCGGFPICFRTILTVLLLGVSVPTAYALAGCETKTDSAGSGPGTANKGGNLRMSMRVQEMTDPAKFDWTETTRVARVDGGIRLNKFLECIQP